MRGPVGSQILITIVRNGVANPIQTKAVLDIIRIGSV
jgi:C-terminal processing protease CtpA/Prc